jgi:hypothetical protein
MVNDGRLTHDIGGRGKKLYTPDQRPVLMPQNHAGTS